MNPPIARTPSTRESILRGRDLFLGRTPRSSNARVATARWPMGDGPSFVEQDVFNDVVFGGNPSERPERIDAATTRRPRRSGTRSRTTGATRSARPT